MNPHFWKGFGKDVTKVLPNWKGAMFWLEMAQCRLGMVGMVINYLCDKYGMPVTSVTGVTSVVTV